ncbi:hypothetical protein CSC65_13725 [Pseudoxanthomonas daejeonensis]|uniref:Autotransporter domain-containing protein n=1 Tax=Pseudoxanthomonas daejeonensis TaxID=266062 RepID=A0ABQ6Z534_9GAMM|nr:hypothetical protein CSC65_13725 [Pseudoxanthomonas daejeonensis]
MTADCTIEAVYPLTWPEFGMTGGRQSDFNLFVHGGAAGGGWVNLADGDYRFRKTEIAGTSLVVWDTLVSDVFVHHDFTGMGFVGTSELWLTGTVRGNVVNEEVLNLRHRCGTGLNLCAKDSPRRIEGNYTQGATGTMVAVLGDPLQVTGSAALDGALLLAGGTSQGWVLPTAPSAIQVLRADGGVSGTFVAWGRDLNGARTLFLEGSLRYTANEVIFDATRVSLSSAMVAAGATALQVGVGARLDDAFRIGDGLAGRPPGGLDVAQQRFLESAAAIQHLDSIDQARRTFDSLSGQAHALAPRMLDRQLTDLSLHLERQLDALPAVQAQGSWAEPIANVGYVGGWQSSGGFSAGQTWRLDAAWQVGGSVAQLDSRTQLDGMGGVVDARTPVASVHARYGGDGWQATAIASYVDADLLVRRPIELGVGRSSLAGSERTLRQGRMYGEARRDLQVGGGRVSPFVGMDYVREHGDAFREQGSTGLELVAGASSREAWSGLAGVRYAKDWMLPRRGRIGLDLDLRYRQWLGGNDATVRAAFAGTPQAAFALDAPWDESQGALRVALAGDIGAGWRWTFDGTRALGGRYDDTAWSVLLQRDLGADLRPARATLAP